MKELKVPKPGGVIGEATRELGKLVRDIMKENKDNFRLFCPDETNSNRFNHVFEETGRMYLGEILDSDDDLTHDGRVMEVLSEHLCQGWLEGYLLTGRYGIFPCYEAFENGFSRRFATYKRVDLLLHDEERLINLLQDKKIQVIVAGKAYPADEPSQALIEKWISFNKRPEVAPYAAFLSDYDIQLAERLVQGMDLWVNTPKRPWEASGTSGMKVLVNGGLNFSSLDGWWAEAYTPDVGWAIKGDDDGKDAKTLFDTLENDIIPLFYHRNAQGIPQEWLKKVKTSMARLTPEYSTNRMVRDYVEHYYLGLQSMDK